MSVVLKHKLETSEMPAGENAFAGPLAHFALPARPRILIITLRRLGDVLLTTPLVRTIRRGFPEAALDVLVFRGSERILEGNPDVRNILALPERPSLRETLGVLLRLWRRYDLVVSTQAGDRP